MAVNCYYNYFTVFFLYETRIDFIPFGRARAPTHLSVSLTQRPFSFQRFETSHKLNLTPTESHLDLLL